MFTMVASSTTMSWATAMIARATQRFGSRLVLGALGRSSTLAAVTMPPTDIGRAPPSGGARLRGYEQARSIVALSATFETLVTGENVTDCQIVTPLPGTASARADVL